MPPSSTGVLICIGRYMPSANASAGTPVIRNTTAKTAPRPNMYHCSGCAVVPKMPTRISFIADAWGAGIAALPNPPSVCDSSHMARPQKIAATSVPTNFSASCLAGVAPIQWPTFRSDANAPDAASAVQTTPPTIIVTNIPLPPVSPIFDITRPVMIKVSMVMPDTGLVPTMAIARADTGANRKAITITSSVPASA